MENHPRGLSDFLKLAGICSGKEKLARLLPARSKADQECTSKKHFDAGSCVALVLFGASHHQTLQSFLSKA
jgi:hypothetical protein